MDPNLLRHLLFKTAASIQIFLSDVSTRKLSPHLSKTRQPRELARIQSQLIYSIHSFSSRILLAASARGANTSRVGQGGGDPASASRKPATGHACTRRKPLGACSPSATTHEQQRAQPLHGMPPGDPRAFAAPPPPPRPRPALAASTSERRQCRHTSARKKK